MNVNDIDFEMNKIEALTTACNIRMEELQTAKNAILKEEKETKYTADVDELYSLIKDEDKSLRITDKCIPRSKSPVLNVVPNLIKVVERISIPSDIDAAVNSYGCKDEFDYCKLSCMAHAIYRAGYFDGAGDAIMNFKEAGIIPDRQFSVCIDRGKD